MPENKRGTSKRGFASMDPEKQKAIASLGGRTAHQQGVAHRWTSDEAREAGRKGGQSTENRRNNASQDRPRIEDPL
jgi:general stress protein YciG